MSECVKILVGDNTYNFGKLCSEMLARVGFEVITTPKDGLEVLNAIKLYRPNIVIIDSIMPHIDAMGIIKCIAIFNEDFTPSFMVVSSYENSVFQQQTLEIGAVEYVLKPFDIKFLCDRIFVLAKSLLPSRILQPIDSESLELEGLIAEMLQNLGMQLNLKGYMYLKQSIVLSVCDDEMIYQVTKLLYPTVAKKFNTTTISVERAIRHAIVSMWNRGNATVLSEFFSSKSKPTNSAAIALITEKIKLKIKNHNFT